MPIQNFDLGKSMIAASSMARTNIALQDYAEKKQKSGAIAQARADVVDERPDAVKVLQKLDPEGFEQTINNIMTADKSKQAEIDATTTRMAKIVASVKREPTEEGRAKKWNENVDFLVKAGDEGAEAYRDRYSPAMADHVLMQAMAVKDINEMVKFGKVEMGVNDDGDRVFLVRNQAGQMKEAQMPEGIRPEPARKGTELKVDAEGGVTFSQGGRQLDKTNQRKVEDKIFNKQEAVARYRSINESFNADLLKAKPKLKAAFAKAKNFFDIDVSPEEKKLVKDMTVLYRRTAENLALFIKDMSGAAVSEQEAKRLSKIMPTTEDAPLVFEAKLTDVMEQTQAALWRHNYALQKGLDPVNSGLSMYDMPDIIEREGQKIELEIRKQNQGMSDSEIDSEVAKQLQSMFGSTQ